MARSARKPRVRKFCYQLRDARTAAELKQEQLAQRAGISVGHYSKLERGVHDPSHEHLKALAAALDMTLDKLVNGVHERPCRDSNAPSA